MESCDFPALRGRAKRADAAAAVRGGTAVGYVCRVWSGGQGAAAADTGEVSQRPAGGWRPGGCLGWTGGGASRSLYGGIPPVAPLQLAHWSYSALRSRSSRMMKFVRLMVRASLWIMAAALLVCPSLRSSADQASSDPMALMKSIVDQTLTIISDPSCKTD